MDTSTPFKCCHFQAEIILLGVRWYLRYPLSYRNLEEMMRERGLQIDHTTIYRWVQSYAPELEKRCRPPCPFRVLWLLLLLKRWGWPRRTSSPARNLHWRSMK